MLLFMSALACFTVGGLLRRIAGGLAEHWIGSVWGTTIYRLIQSIGMGGITLAVSQNYQWALGTIPLVFIGTTWGFPVWQLRWPFINLKHSNMVPKDINETISLSLNGLMACMPLALGGFWLGLSWAWLIMLAGLTRGPVYWLASAHTPAWRWMEFEEWNPDQVKWVLAPTALTEFYSGGFYALALWATLKFD